MLACSLPSYSSEVLDLIPSTPFIVLLSLRSSLGSHISLICYHRLWCSQLHNLMVFLNCSPPDQTWHCGDLWSLRNGSEAGPPEESCKFSWRSSSMPSSRQGWPIHEANRSADSDSRLGGPRPHLNHSPFPPLSPQGCSTHQSPCPPSFFSITMLHGSLPIYPRSSAQTSQPIPSQENMRCAF